MIAEAGDDCAEEFAAAVSERFVDNGLELVDRQNLDAMFQEMDFGLSGRIDPSSAVELGKMLGPTALVSVKVQRCAVEQNRLAGQAQELQGRGLLQVHRSNGGLVQGHDPGDGPGQRTGSSRPRPSTPRSDWRTPSNEGYPAYPSKFEVRDLMMAEATNRSTGCSSRGTSGEELYFFNDDECGLKTAYGLMKIGEIESAATQSEENLELCKTADVKPKFLARAYYNLGMARFLQSRFDEALELLKTAFGIDGGNIISESIAECRKAQSLAAAMAELDDGGGFEVPAGSQGAEPTVQSASMNVSRERTRPSVRRFRAGPRIGDRTAREAQGIVRPGSDHQGGVRSQAQGDPRGAVSRGRPEA